MATNQKHRYEFQEIEARWQQVYQDRDLFATSTDPDREFFYYLDMFPYPSGNLHMGHLRNYTIGDVISRYQTMLGKNVLHPMGWDAFGLPAENAAIKNQTHPAAWTRQCIANMHRQFGMVGISFDWEREVTTCEPDYYRWTQWLFLQFFRQGLAERQSGLLNWCPSCDTVLANEQVLTDGTCERCGNHVDKRRLEQWFFKITRYAQRLLDDIDRLDRWPEAVRTMQRNWIGRSEGVQFQWRVAERDIAFEVFTTRIDTVFGVTFMALAPESPLVDQLVAGTDRADEVKGFVRDVLAEDSFARASADAEKRGIFTGAHAVHPLTGALVPIWVANYVMMDYGTGAIMAVPAHDERDYQFARRYELPIPPVIIPAEATAETVELPYIGEGVQVNSGAYDGLPNREAMVRIAEGMEAAGTGRRTVNYRLRDWCISRQRYWGCPIPVVYCETCGIQPVPDEDLPVLLPTDVEFTGQGNPLATSPTFQQCRCPACGGPARRETDTMDTFVDSSWYFLRYASQPDDRAFDRAEVDRWLPVTQYVGGIEHATMHLIYARFFTKVLFDLGLVGFEEPFAALFTQGMVTREAWWSPSEKKWYNDPAEIAADGGHTLAGVPVERQVAKMSKSIGNVVPPEDLCRRFGADTGRCYVLFIGPPEAEAEWQDNGVPGVHRFLTRVHRAFCPRADLFRADWREVLAGAVLTESQKDVRRKLHQTIDRITNGIERFALNTSVAALMELINEVLPYAEGLTAEADPVSLAVFSEAAETYALLLSPFAPHLADEIWAATGHPGTCYEAWWPAVDETALETATITIVIQVKGKVRDRVEVPADSNEESVKEAALASEKVRQQIAGQTIRKVIYIPGKLVNIVV